MLLGLIIKIIYWLAFAAVLWWCYYEDLNSYLLEHFGGYLSDGLSEHSTERP